MAKFEFMWVTLPMRYTMIDYVVVKPTWTNTLYLTSVINSMVTPGMVTPCMVTPGMVTPDMVTNLSMKIRNGEIWYPVS